MSEDSGRRRTGFERDLRELFMKIVFGLVLAVVMYAWVSPDSWAGPIIVGQLASFGLAALIRGDSRHADDR
jgi:hypothetical protein